jgi:hypothetical protein
MPLKNGFFNYDYAALLVGTDELATVKNLEVFQQVEYNGQPIYDADGEAIGESKKIDAVVLSLGSEEIAFEDGSAIGAFLREKTDGVLDIYGLDPDDYYDYCLVVGLEVITIDCDEVVVATDSDLQEASEKVREALRRLGVEDVTLKYFLVG